MCYSYSVYHVLLIQYGIAKAELTYSKDPTTSEHHAISSTYSMLCPYIRLIYLLNKKLYLEVSYQSFLVIHCICMFYS